MSQHEWSIRDTGLVINDELCAYLMKAAFKRFPDRLDDQYDEVKKAFDLLEDEFAAEAQMHLLPEEFFDTDMLCDIFEEDENMNDLARIGNFEGSAETNDEIAEAYGIGTEQCVSISFHYDERGAYVPLQKAPALFRQPYLNPVEAVAELRESIAEYSEFIPSDFKFAPLVCNINGVIFD